MTYSSELRAMLLATLAGCASTVVSTDAAAPDGSAPDVTAPDVSAPDVTAPDGTAPDVTAPDGTAPDAPVCPGRTSRECLTEAEVESRIRTPPQGGGGPFDAGADVPPITAPRAPNGCYVAEAVRNGCCIAAALVEREGERCCYTYCEGACCGRPFFVGGLARRAACVDDSPWAPARTAPAALDAGTRAALARAWRDDALTEHASVASFARFTLQLLALGAPPDLVADAQRAALDEVDHARRCFAVATALDGDPSGPGALDVTGALGAVSLAGAVRAAVAEGCVGETTAALLARRRAEGCANAEARASLARIADDEARHAALAWRFVAWGVAQGGDAARDAAREAFAEALAGLDGPLAAPSAVDDATWRAHGLATWGDQRAALASARRDVLMPCAAALLGAAPASGRNDELRATI
jgi:hypothetical protein